MGSLNRPQVPENPWLDPHVSFLLLPWSLEPFLLLPGSKMLLKWFPRMQTGIHRVFQVTILTKKMTVIFRFGNKEML